jgi:hypothetical protein
MGLREFDSGGEIEELVLPHLAIGNSRCYKNERSRRKRSCSERWLFVSRDWEMLTRMWHKRCITWPNCMRSRASMSKLKPLINERSVFEKTL